MARKNRGHQRVEMVKMQNQSNLQVTFSKRRFGLFKKANELVTLCDAEIALIVFSPGEKVFSFGHPSVEIIIEKYINQNSHSGYYNSGHILDAPHNVTVHGLVSELSHIEQLLEDAKRYAEALDQRIKNRPIKHWWQAPIDELTPPQLDQLKVAMKDLKKDADEELHKFMGLYGRNLAAFSAGASGFSMSNGKDIDYGRRYF